jgi:hypothetical protein
MFGTGATYDIPQTGKRVQGLLGSFHFLFSPQI